MLSAPNRNVPDGRHFGERLLLFVAFYEDYAEKEKTPPPFFSSVG